MTDKELEDLIRELVNIHLPHDEENQLDTETICIVRATFRRVLEILCT